MCRSSVDEPRFINDDDLPHFSWHVAESYDQDKLCKLLESIGQETIPFMAHTAGLGIFTTPIPVVYIAIVKDRPLLELHERLWRQLGGLGRGTISHYAPELWAPHITLAHENMDPVSMGRIVQELSNQPFDWEIPVKSLAIASQAGSDPMQTCFQFSFTKG